MSVHALLAAVEALSGGGSAGQHRPQSARLLVQPHRPERALRARLVPAAQPQWHVHGRLHRISPATLNILDAHFVRT